MKAFVDEYSKSGKFAFVVLNCDKTEKAYSEHLKAMEWAHCLPYDLADDKIATLEEGANAETIPKLAIFSLARGFEKAVVDDIKMPVIKHKENMEEACAEVEKERDN